MYINEQIITVLVPSGKLKREITQQNHTQMNNPDNLITIAIIIIVCIILIFQSNTPLPTVDQVE